MRKNYSWTKSQKRLSQHCTWERELVEALGLLDQLEQDIDKLLRLRGCQPPES